MILPMEVMVATEVNLLDKTLLAEDSYRVFHSSCHIAGLVGSLRACVIRQCV